MSGIEQNAPVRTSLERLFAPRSIVVVGVSADPAKRGYQALKALRAASYTGGLYGVNPRGGQVFDLALHTDVADLPYGLDVALIALPGPLVPGTLRKLAERGVAGAVVLANGFGETGEVGARLDVDLAEAIAETGIRVVGPNTSGMLATSSGVNLVGLAGVPSGPVSLVTQSGNMLLSFVADTRAHEGLGLDTYIGLGNQADVRYDECVTQLARQPGTHVIAIHSEGLKSGRDFLVAAAEAARRCPVVMLRGGRSATGQRTALSHTGSVAGSDAVAAAVLKQAGVELVDRSDELAVVASVLAGSRPVPGGLGVALLSDGGGHATLAADALAHAGVPLAELVDETRQGLRTLLGPAAAVSNPIDVAGATDADPARFADVAELLLTDPTVGLVLIVGLYGGYHLRFDSRLEPAEDSTARELADLSARLRSPIVIQSAYAAERPENHRILRDQGIPVIASIDHAVRAVAALYRRGQRLATLHERADLRLPSASPADPANAELLSEPAARALVQAAGLDIGPWVVATGPANVAEAVSAFGVPCAVKVISPEVAHKSDVGGVELNVTTETAAAAWAKITTSVTASVPNAQIDGMVVTPMMGKGVELLVGVTADPIFGPVVAFGSGGVMVEALRDVAFRAAPFTQIEAKEMIDETIAARMLDGYRGLPRVDRDQLAAFLVRVGDLAANNPDLVELDLNPVIAVDGDIRPVDVRIVLDRSHHA